MLPVSDSGHLGAKVREILARGMFQARAIGLRRIFRREISCLNGLQTELAA
jgi:hypothetical protein